MITPWWECNSLKNYEATKDAARKWAEVTDRICITTRMDNAPDLFLALSTDLPGWVEIVPSLKPVKAEGFDNFFDPAGWARVARCWRRIQGLIGATELVIEPETLAKETDLWGPDLLSDIGCAVDMIKELDDVPCRWSLPKILSDYGAEGRQADTAHLIKEMASQKWLLDYWMFKDAKDTGESARGWLHASLCDFSYERRAYLNLSGQKLDSKGQPQHPCYTPADAASLDGRYLYMPAGEALQLAEAWPR